MTATVGWGLAALLIAGCARGAPDRERAGDKAWHEGRWTDAIVEYRAAVVSPRVMAKLADAALEADSLVLAADAWLQVGTLDETRRGEAAAGLARTAAAADREGNQQALVTSVFGLGRMAPGWPLGRLAARLTHWDDVAPEVAVAVLPAALAGSPGRMALDPLLVALARAHRAMGACDRAVPMLDGVLSRDPRPGLADSAKTTLQWCELGLGLAALQHEEAGEAERWLDRAVRHDPDGAVGQRALVGFGDARLRQGDSAAATLAWQAVVGAHLAPDSIIQLALDRLRSGAPAAARQDTIR